MGKAINLQLIPSTEIYACLALNRNFFYISSRYQLSMKKHSRKVYHLDPIPIHEGHRGYVSCGGVNVLRRATRPNMKFTLPTSFTRALV